MNKDSVNFVLEELWNFESAYSGRVSPVKGGITLVRWNKDAPLSITNAIPLAVSEVQNYYNETLTFTEEQVQAIETSFKAHK